MEYWLLFRLFVFRLFFLHSRRLGSFFMSMHYKPMHPWRRCVVMDRMWMTMAKSVSMAGIIMGRMPHLMGYMGGKDSGTSTRTITTTYTTLQPPPNKRPHYPATRRRSPPLSTLETCTDQYMLRWMPIIDTKGYHQAASSSTSWPMSM